VGYEELCDVFSIIFVMKCYFVC